MLSMTILLLVAGLSLSSAATGLPQQIDVDCRVDGELERALAVAEASNGADIHLHGICEGGVVIATDGVTLRGVTPDAGLEAPDSDPDVQALVEVVNAQVSLRNLMLHGGIIGVLADGWDADVLLFQVELSDQQGGVFARNGADVRLLDSTVRDGSIGVLAQFNATVILQNTVVTGHDTGIVVFNESRVALTDSTVENNRTGGLQLGGRCDGFVSGGAFRENGQVHIFAGSRSDITLLGNPIVGTEEDSTQAAFGVNEHSTITSFNTPMIYGDLHVLDHGSLLIGNTTVEGYLIASIFSDAFVSNSEIVNGVFCDSGSDVVCAGSTTTPSVTGCPSPTCGAAPASAPGRLPLRALEAPTNTVLEVRP